MKSDTIILSNKIEMTQDQNIYDFVSQFQLSTNKILCLINKSKLHFYDDNDNDFPKKVKLAHKDRSNNLMTIYHFNDVDTKDVYYLFGKESAQRFLLSITKRSESSCKFNYVKSSIINNPTNNCLIKVINNNEVTIINDDNNKIMFVNYNPQLKIENLVD